MFTLVYKRIVYSSAGVKVVKFLTLDFKLQAFVVRMSFGRSLFATHWFVVGPFAIMANGPVCSRFDSMTVRHSVQPISTIASAITPRPCSVTVKLA